MRLVPLALVFLGVAATAQDAGWKRYSNTKYAYGVCYPPELVPQREADDGDGREFKSRDGQAVARAFARYEQTLDGGKAPLSAELDNALT